MEGNPINYTDIANQHPWILQENQSCILSPDSDGLLCGLFMSNVLNWKVSGFYDGKILVLDDSKSPEECIFLDMEIFRSEFRSVGHHMLLYNKGEIPDNWANLNSCIQPNNLRSFDVLHDFSKKYPLATIHLLLGIVGNKIHTNLPDSAIIPLLFTDGTWMNLFQYMENILDWLEFLKSSDEDNPLKIVFHNDHYSVYELMDEMNNFLRERDAISVPGERGDRVAITLRGGSGDPHNLDSNPDGTFSFSSGAKDRAERFINLLAELTQWGYETRNWAWNNWKLYKFGKEVRAETFRLNQRTFNEIISRNPLSWAVTARHQVEYTLETPDSVS